MFEKNDDKQLCINWNLPNQILQLSEKDQNLPSLSNIKSPF